MQSKMQSHLGSASQASYSLQQFISAQALHGGKLGSGGGQTTGSPVLLSPPSLLLAPLLLLLVSPGPVLVSSLVVVSGVPVVVLEAVPRGPVLSVLFSVVVAGSPELLVVGVSPLELVAVVVVVVALVLAVAGSLAVVDSPLLASDLPPPQAARTRARVTERRRGEEVMAGRYAGAIGLPRILRDRRGDAGPTRAIEGKRRLSAAVVRRRVGRRDLDAGSRRQTPCGAMDPRPPGSRRS